jgi:hypothetical protein
MIDDGHAGCHSATVAENSSAGLETSTMISTHDFGLGGGADQNKQTSNSNRSHLIYSYRWRWGCARSDPLRPATLRQHAQDDGYRFFYRIRLLVAVTAVLHLLIGVKNLFVDAKMRCRHREASARLIRRLSAPVPLSTEHARP